MFNDHEDYDDVWMDARFDFDEETGDITFPSDGVHFPQMDGCYLFDDGTPAIHPLKN